MNIFFQAKNWIKELRRIVGEDIAVCIVGNKIDLEKNRTVQTKEAEKYVVTMCNIIIVATLYASTCAMYSQNSALTCGTSAEGE